jgi:WD40 repeat protein
LIISSFTDVQVSSICFDSTGSHLLSYGQDSTARLWDVSSGEMVMRFDGAKHTV